MYIGVDVGTTGTKAMLVDDNGTILNTEYSGYETYREREGYSEQNALDWWSTMVQTVSRCTKNLPNKKRVRALALSTQSGTVVATNSHCEPIAKAITWQDTRSATISERLNEQYDKEHFYKKTGWRLAGSYNFLALMWIKENQAALFEQADKFLSVNEYLNYMLTGKFIGDYVNAGITQLFDIKKHAYSSEMLGLLEMPESKLAELLPSGTHIGCLTDRAAQELGLCPETKVVLAGQDQYCAALGLGAIHDGDVAMSTGSAWVLLPISERPLFDTEAYISPGLHICENMWGNMATLTTGGVSIEWCRKLFGTEKLSYDEVNQCVQNTPMGSNGLMLLPFFQGATCPIWNNNIKATLFGMELRHEKADIISAVMEGVAMQANLILDTVRSCGCTPKALKMSGGAVKSRVWTQIIADVTNTPLEITETPDMACFGAAMVAAKACGEFSSYDEGLANWPIEKRRIMPDKSKVQEYSRLYDKYKSRVSLIEKMY